MQPPSPLPFSHLSGRVIGGVSLGEFAPGWNLPSDKPNLTPEGQETPPEGHRASKKLVKGLFNQRGRDIVVGAIQESDEKKQ